ncbi:MAG: carboxypeptidase-like regulatory domain-containing protein [Saprospiraceae bacterium]|nr:carboxypeptidase-like regulatory domain-containing protein [Saprospiraceae bacterium]
MTSKYLFLLILCFCSCSSFAQEDSEIVEVYGLILTKGELVAYEYVPFVTVALKGTNRGTYANYEGMYSIVVKKGQKLVFSAIGFEDREIEIPKDIKGMYYSLTVELEVAEIAIEEVIVFPWPDRNNLAAEFLAMQPNKAAQLEDIAKENLNKNELLALAATSDMDGKESSSFYMRQQANDYSYQGQQGPQPIFDPIAWSKFFKQWKKKKMTAKEEQMIKILEGENE